MEIMEGYFDGECLRVVEKDANGTVKDLAIDYLVYGALAEIFGREAGFNKGMGGSMHAFFPPFGIYPNNAIVGGSGDISVGAALFKQVNHKPGIVIGNIGDASAGCGPVWEGICFATMDQFKELWDEAHRGGLPLIMNFVNNFYGMGGQPVGETMGFKVLARLGAGVNPEQMHAERVDGFNPLAVIDAIGRKKKILERGDGPGAAGHGDVPLLGHSPSDASSYREKAEVEAWQKVDPLIVFARSWWRRRSARRRTSTRSEQQAEELILKAYKKAVDLAISPRADLKGKGSLLERTMFSNQKVESLDEPGRKPEVLMPKEENPRVKQLATRSRIGVRREGQEAAQGQVRRHSRRALRGDPRPVLRRSDAGGVRRGEPRLGRGVRRLSRADRGAAVPPAVQLADLRGGDRRHGGRLRAGGRPGARGADVLRLHGPRGRRDLQPAVQVAVDVRRAAEDAGGAAGVGGLEVRRAAQPGLDEHVRAHPGAEGGLPGHAVRRQGADVRGADRHGPGGLLREPADLRRAGAVRQGRRADGLLRGADRRAGRQEGGKDLTILTIGATLYRALEAAKVLEEKYGITCEVIDARSIVPFNYEKVIESVKKTRKILLACDACERGSVLQTMAAKITQFAFDELDAPPVVVGARNWITPADEVEDAFFPYPCDILDAVHEHIVPLKGYTVSRDCGDEELMRRSREGI